MFETNQMPYIIENDMKPRFLFQGIYADRIKRDVTYLNAILIGNRSKYHIPRLYMDVNEINFAPHPGTSGPVNYSFLWLNDLTPTGKLPKYVQTAYLVTKCDNYLLEWGEETRAQIHYLKDGVIGKARIVMWRNKKLYVAHFALNSNKELVLRIA